MASSYRLGPTRRAINALVRCLLWVGVAPARTYLLTVVGHRSGARRSTPVTLVEGERGRFLVAPYGTVGWVRNVRAAGGVTLNRGRHRERARAVEIGAAEAAPVLRRYLTDVPITRPFFDVTPASSLAAFEAEAPRHPVFQLLPE